ncbi:hypothetical protein DFH08DRAFT_833492 [Mycena albidolilacea]|uniref:F-box domain-containing protein n=1 Tax=Mycena albidolilacea TaxID=1033008 RepID=A0AAD7AQF9_9AGAR|nr:hypothetical protein DFH08DRAFT_833492 [Mycena albidolilacea]
MSGLTDLPEDVFFELAKQLDVDDLINLLSSCQVMWRLRSQRIIWVDALVRLREIHNQPVPLSNREALNIASLRELQDSAGHSNRLMRNLSSDSPHPVHRRVLLFESEGQWTSFFYLPGTGLAVSHRAGSLSCWNIITSERVALLEISDLRVKIEAPCMNIVGKALIGACIGEDVRNLVAITIDYGDPAHISVSHVISSPMNNTSAFRSPFFINSHVLGFCTYASIVFWCMDANIEVQDRLQEFPSPAGFGMHYLPFGPMLYGFHKGSIVAEAAIQRIPFLPASDVPLDTEDNDLLLPVSMLPLPYPFATNQSELRRLGRIRHMHFGASSVFAPDYGVFAVTCRTFKWEGRRRSVIHFWPGRPGARGRLDVGQAHFYEHPDIIRRIAVGASGTYVLILVLKADYGNDEPYLGEGDGYVGLLHFTPTPTPRTTFRKLDTGGALPLDCDQILLDDSLGLVSFSFVYSPRVTTLFYV